jgi:two-component system sensor histidine kinase UhpB
MSVFLGIVLMFVSATLLPGIPPAHKFAQTFTGGMFALCAATLLARASYCYFGPPMNDQNASSGLYGVFFVAIAAEMAAFSTGLALLADEQMISELDGAKKRISLADAEVVRQIEAKAMLRESEERFRFAHRAASIGMFDWNIETGVNTWAPEVEAMYGLRPGGFPGTQKAWEDLVHPDDRARALQHVKESFETGAPVEHEWRVTWPDGSVHWIAGRWQVFRNVAGEPHHMIGVNIDVTDRKNMEEALRRSNDRLRALSARLESVKEEESSRIARELHDELGSALTTLRWDLEWLETTLEAGTPERGPELKHRVAGMLSSSRRTLEAVRRIATELRPSILDDLGIVEAVEWKAQQFQMRTGIQIDFTSSVEAADLSPKQSTAVYRILQEALTNVIRHSLATRVEISAEQNGGYFVLTVRDNGKGISPSEPSNTSLGLWSMRERAHLLGGTVEIVGPEGRGTTVVVRVPLAFELGNGATG